MLLVLAIAGSNARLLFGSTWDDVRYHTEVTPPRLAAATAVQQGLLPGWWDGTGLGVPLAAEPSHGALYPPTWIASSPRAFDWLAIAHLVWLAIGIAVWARLRSSEPPRHRTWLGEASEPAAVVVAILVATGGLATSAAMRGALPAIAHLPWIGAASAWLAHAESKRDRTRAAVALGALIGLVGLAGFAGSLADALILAVALGARRRTLGYLAVGIAGGLAIAAAQWVPAIFELMTPRAGAEVTAIPIARLVELIVPLASGSPDPERALATLAGDTAWAPSVFVGAPLLALAAVRSPSRRLLIVLGSFTALALIVGRGGWPQALGAPELHLAALVIALGAHAGAGLDALVAGERRAFLAVVAGTGCAVVALAAIAVLRSRSPGAALDRALIDGGFCLICSIAVLALAWRGPKRSLPIVFALLVLPGIGSQHSTAPVIDRSIVETPPAWAEAAANVSPPRRVFRPVYMTETTPDRHSNVTTPNHHPERPVEVETVDDAMSTFAGASGWRWGIAAARSEDPARPPAFNRAWDASAFGGGVLLDRYGISLAILPSSIVVPRGLHGLNTRGRWTLVDFPVTSPATVMRGWSRASDPADALALLFPGEGQPKFPSGAVVLGTGGPSQPAHGPPLSCTIDDWSAGDIALRCTTDLPGYAVVSSTPSPGWSVTVDDVDNDWDTADVLRRAVAVSAGTHAVHWHYDAPGLRLGWIIAGLGLTLLIASMLAARREGSR